MSTSITGAVLEPQEFRLVQCAGRPSPEYILQLLEGRLAALHIRCALAEHDARQIVERFWSSPGLRAREDGVEGYFLGAYQYGKTFEEYARETEELDDHIKALFQNIANPIDFIIGTIKNAVARQGDTVRRAIWRGLPVATARALTWTSSSELLLAPHDDLGQLMLPAQSDFEIQKAAQHTVLAVNIYPSAPSLGGDLRIWNICPDNESRRKFGIEFSGFPYPQDALEGFSSFDIPVVSGDIVISNGGLVHAVTGYSEREYLARDRLLLNFSFGRIDTHTVVHWV